MTQKISIALAGNPNCGKTTLFNALTGSHQTVGNWPGVTVEKKSGSFTVNDQQITLVDLPGAYSLQPCDASSEDERVAREYILSGESSLVVNIVDASNLERNLYLTAQLIEIQVPLIVAVNMLDIAKNHSISVDLDKLAQELGCPVVGLWPAKSCRSSSGHQAQPDRAVLGCQWRQVEQEQRCDQQHHRRHHGSQHHG